MVINWQKYDVDSILLVTVQWCMVMLVRFVWYVWQHDVVGDTTYNIVAANEMWLMM